MSSPDPVAGDRRRQRRAVRRRRRAALALLLAALAAGGLAIALLRTGHKAGTTSQHAPAAEKRVRKRPPAVEAGVLPWGLAVPLSREVVVPKTGTPDLVVLGGLESRGSSADGVYALDTRTGRLSPHGTLVQATHDAAGAALGRRVFVIGGGTAVPAASTQIQAGGKTVAGGALAQARADASAVTIGDTVYVVGGYDGSGMDREVVATTDGRSYRAVAALPVPVRYPALAALGSRIYVFGGLGASGRPSDAVQL
ncbi:MAG: hypothetical protein ACRDNS_11385, partial [Trebonia sp.]